MALLDVEYIKAKMSTSTFLSIFDDANVGDGSYDELGVEVNIADAEAEVYSWVKRNYPSLPLPVSADPPPVTLRLAAFGFFYVFARDRKPEYWGKTQETERMDRLKAAYALVERYAKNEQVLYDTGQTPSNTGGQVGTQTDPNFPETPEKFFVDGTSDF